MEVRPLDHSRRCSVGPSFINVSGYGLDRRNAEAPLQRRNDELVALVVTCLSCSPGDKNVVLQRAGNEKSPLSARRRQPPNEAR